SGRDRRGAENRDAREPWCGDARIGSDSPQGLPAAGAAVGRLRRQPGAGLDGFFTRWGREACRSEQHQLLVLLLGLDEEIGPERRAPGVEAEPPRRDLEAAADLPGIGTGAAHAL